MEKTLKVYIYKEGEKPTLIVYDSNERKQKICYKETKRSLFVLNSLQQKMVKATTSPYSYDLQSVVPYLNN